MTQHEVQGLLSGDAWNRKVKGDDVYETELVRTSTESNAEFALVDRTSVLVGSGAIIRFDKVIFNPNNSVKAIAVSSRLGATRFSSGTASAYLIRTPQANIEPLGTVFDVFVEQKTTVVLRGRVGVHRQQSAELQNSVKTR